MGEIVSLRRARKDKRRQRQADEAARNRLSFGQPKAERWRQERERAKAERVLDGHRLPPEDDA